MKKPKLTDLKAIALWERKNSAPSEVWADSDLSALFFWEKL